MTDPDEPATRPDHGPAAGVAALPSPSNDPRLGRWSAPSWLLFTLAGIVAAMLLVLQESPVSRATHLSAIAAASVGALVVGVRRNPAARRAPWLVLVPAIVVLVGGTVAADLISEQAGRSGDAVRALQGTQVVGVPLMFWCLLQFARTGRRGVELDSLLDGLILGIAFGFLTWRAVLRAPLTTSEVSTFRLLIANVMPALDIIVAVALVRRILSAARTAVALKLVFGSVLVFSASHLISAVAIFDDTPLHQHAPMQALGCVLLGAAALHPSMARVTDADSVGPQRFGAARIGLLALALLDTPFLLLLDRLRGTTSVDATLLVGSSAISSIVVVRLIGLAKSAERASERERAGERRFKSLVQNSSDLVAVIDPAGRVTYVSPAVDQILGRTPADMIGRELRTLFHPDDLDRAVDALLNLGDGETSELVRVRVRNRSGRWRWIEARSVDRVHDPSIAGTVLNGRDVTERVAAEAALAATGAQQRAVARLGREALAAPHADAIATIAAELTVQTVAATETVVALTDPDGGLRVVVATSEGTAERRVAALDDVPAVAACMAQIELLVVDDPGVRGSLLGTEGDSGSGLLDVTDAPPRAFDPEEVAVALLAPVVDHEQSIGVIAVRRPAAASFTAAEASFVETMARTMGLAVGRRRAEEKATHDALHDNLTTLPNRALFVDRLSSAIARRERSGKAVAVIFLDVDHFKVVNDSLGHSAGDRILTEIALRLKALLRPGDTVARFGGDEFTLLLDDLDGLDDAVEIAHRLRAELAAEITFGGAQLHPTVSLGVAVADALDATAESMLRDADAAMYRAKERGRDRVEVFDDTMRDRAITRLRTEIDLRRALRRDELVLHFQPIVDLADGTVRGYEALVRWDHPRAGLIPPAEFIPVAEQSGLIGELSEWVLRDAMRQCAHWSTVGEAGPQVSINVSARSLASPGLTDMVALALADTGVPAARVCLEVTESALMSDLDHSLTTLASLRDLGVSLAIDDFGTGYSSLTYLKQFPVDVLKIDSSFVAGLGQIPEDAAIVGAVVGMAATLGRTAVAEGVERPDQLAELRRLGCPLAQGFLLGRPGPAVDTVPTRPLDLDAAMAPVPR